MNYADLSLEQIRVALNNRDFLSSDLVTYYLDRCAQEASLNCFISLDEDYVRDRAQWADQHIVSGHQTPLLGIPVAIKDLLLVEGLSATAASSMLENFNAPYSATVIHRLIEAGAVIFGKTNMDEFAMGSSNENSAWGPVKNPWNRDAVSGGSSGGSAAAVAAGLCPVSIGTDTGGSIRQPASYCGIVGIKPTYGRVSRYGVIAFASSLDQVGVFARTAIDAARVLQIISGHDPKDSTSVDIAVPDLARSLGDGVAGLRIGVPKEYFIDELNSEIKAIVWEGIRTLEQRGATIVDISLPHTEYAVPTYYIIAPAEAASNLSRYDGVRYGVRAENCEDLLDLYCRSRSNGFGEEVQRRILVGTYVLSQGYYDAYYLRAQKVRRLIANDFKAVFEADCDMIACPTAPTTAFGIGEKTNDPVAMYLNDIFTIPASLAGLPALSVPCGFDSAGMPVGLQLIGKPWEEERILQAAYEYEQATEWHRTRPASA